MSYEMGFHTNDFSRDYPSGRVELFLPASSNLPSYVSSGGELILTVRQFQIENVSVRAPATYVDDGVPTMPSREYFTTIHDLLDAISDRDEPRPLHSWSYSSRGNGMYSLSLPKRASDAGALTFEGQAYSLFGFPREPEISGDSLSSRIELSGSSIVSSPVISLNVLNGYPVEGSGSVDSELCFVLMRSSASGYAASSASDSRKFGSIGGSLVLGLGLPQFGCTLSTGDVGPNAHVSLRLGVRMSKLNCTC